MEKKLLISVVPNAKTSEVARKLARAGMIIEEKDDIFGLVTGSADTSKLGSLKQVPGVQHVEEQRTFDAPEQGEAVQ